MADNFRRQLQGFYSVMKAKDGFIQFGFLAGVTKIGKLSVFSGLNNLKDISMDARYADICGIGEKDLRKYFSKSVEELAEANELTIEDCYVRLAKMYDGYHFCENSEGVYNPFSILNTFDSLRFKDYWVETGTPSFLVEVMKRTDYDKVTGIYTLGFPNLEVKHGFLTFLLNYYTSARGSGNLLIRQMSNDLLTGQPKDFMKRMEAFFAKQNYQI